MKRFSSSNSLITSFYPPQGKQQEENCHHSRDSQAVLDGLDDKDSTSIDEVEQNTDKKRRLSHNQVKALEKIFEVDNKLDPCKKVALARELGLQPRQVAVWFQNRRARWKIKQLEMDYNNLKANYESLMLNYGQLVQNKLILTTELKELKAKLANENVEKTLSFCESESTNNLGETKVLPYSDSSGINQEPIRNIQLLTAPQDLSNPEVGFCLPSQLNACEELMHAKSVLGNAHQQQWMKMEAASPFGSVEESCNIYSADQVLTFGW